MRLIFFFFLVSVLVLLMGTTALEIWFAEICLIWCFWSRSKGASLMRCLSLPCSGALCLWPPKGSLKEAQQLLHCFLGRKEIRKSCFPFQEGWGELFPSPLLLLLGMRGSAGTLIPFSSYYYYYYFPVIFCPPSDPHHPLTGSWLLPVPSEILDKMFGTALRSGGMRSSTFI